MGAFGPPSPPAQPARPPPNRCDSRPGRPADASDPLAPHALFAASSSARATRFLFAAPKERQLGDPAPRHKPKAATPAAVSAAQARVFWNSVTPIPPLGVFARDAKSVYRGR